MDNKKLAELLFPQIEQTKEEIENSYKKRDLPQGARVTRFAPSPTGFLHIGGLFAAFVSERAAHTTDGVFYLRIEDTDKKREVENGVTGIVKGITDFGIKIDEGMLSETESVGDYAPYIQSKRAKIYQSYCKDLVEKGLAYPCFCSAEELNAVREEQEKNKENPGYYGKYAKCRDLTLEQIEENIKNGMPYVLRLKSPGDENKRISFEDGIKGTIEMPENILDIVLLKTDGIPTYHFAHAIDDHLMGTNYVIRGDEWISSAPIHLQLFDVLGFETPSYAHISPIMKEDEETGGKRKLSKRKDPEAAVSYYHEVGYPNKAVLEYLYTIANSNYEQWRMENPDTPMEEFEFDFAHMSKAGALFDLVKLTDVSKTYISKLTTDEVFEGVKAWAEEYNKDFYELLMKDTDYSKSIFAIERGNEKPRKDIAKWEDTPAYTEYFFNAPEAYDFPENLSKEDMIEILQKYKKVYNHNDIADDWFPRVRDMSEALGYAKAPKFYKKNPEEFKGHVGDVSSVIRVAATGRRNTPDLYQILQVLGEKETMDRFDRAISALKEEK
ncbi:MAG: glutamate--tRNA ligase [Clostridia bacterium]|nr:glutamate--tRNA ligase [Clostridia bacterium]